MSPESIYFRSVLPDGTLQNTTFYTFKTVGDELPLHTHPFWHNCLVVKGSVKIYNDQGKEVVLQRGQHAGLKAYAPHAIQALEDETQTIHTRIYKICAEDSAEGERSILFQFTPEESLEIFKTVKKVLAKNVSVSKAR